MAFKVLSEAGHTIPASPWKIVAALSAFELLIVGILGGWVAVRYRIPYVVFLPLTILTYLGAGYFTALGGAGGTAAGALVALLEFSAYAVTGAFGLHPEWLMLSRIERACAVAVATLAGAGCGLVGSWLAA